jgi:hypothetical protein
MDQHNFPSLQSTSNQAQVDNQQIVNAISYAEKLSEATKNESLLNSLSDAQARLKRIPNIEYAIDQFCQLVDELEKTTNLAEACDVMLRFRQRNYAPNTSSRHQESSFFSS